jgi:hypothetical protein
MPAPTISASHLAFSESSERAGHFAAANQGERPPCRSACSVSSESRTLMKNLDALVRKTRSAHADAASL